MSELKVGQIRTWNGNNEKFEIIFLSIKNSIIKSQAGKESFFEREYLENFSTEHKEKKFVELKCYLDSSGNLYLERKQIHFSHKEVPYKIENGKIFVEEV